MSNIGQWVHRPQNVWLRKALFQVHLWMGIGLGLYVLLISVTGSMIVFRNELYKSLWHGPPTVAVSGPRLTGDQLRAAIHRTYPGWEIEYVWPARKADKATEAWLTRNGHRKTRYLDPFTGADLGRSVPLSIQIVAYAIDFHTDLLAGDTGRIINAVGAALATIIALTGLVVWWPGMKDWRRSLTLHRHVHWKRFFWDLHSAAGIWTFAFVLIWGVTGIYVSIPNQFRQVVDGIIHHRSAAEASAQGSPNDLNSSAANPDTDAPRRVRRTFEDKVFRWFYYLHFGNFAGWKVKTIWVILGLAPAGLFFTGFVMWWNRVVSKMLRRRSVVEEGPRMVSAVAQSVLGKP